MTHNIFNKAVGFELESLLLHYNILPQNVLNTPPN